MRIVFRISQITDKGRTITLDKEFLSYEAAESALKVLPTGTYQIQKVFVK